MAVLGNAEDATLVTPPSPTIDEGDCLKTIEEPAIHKSDDVEQLQLGIIVDAASALDEQMAVVHSILKRPSIDPVLGNHSPVKKVRFGRGGEASPIEHIRFISPRRVNPLADIDSITIDIAMKRRRESRKLYEEFMNRVRQRQRPSRLQVPQPVSGWLVCDSVLEALDPHFLADVLVTRLDAFHPPRLLLEEARSVESEARSGRSPLRCFPADTIRTVFVACGMDALTPRCQPEPLSPVEFVRALEEWLRGMVKKEEIQLVAITIPEDGVHSLFASHISQFNEQLRDYILPVEVDGGEPSEKRVEVELLDWDLAVKECGGSELTEEAKIQMLVEAMHLHYGVEFVA